ncbi:hypothetical protein SH1V18_41010 [Vallitalea longa]|uniref:Uncharacterized protein n=1 Tax=Vallitalea longa TaxID=2936439 RepID=A0A9W6DFU7_9FIRM|nr:hypothetical protein [Vallitalea longa]GKX31621.1 hypothetical protein SH1V18_41010 [Vallitalea longa]
MLNRTMIKNIFNVKKSPFWIFTIGIVIIVIISIGIHNNSINKTKNDITINSSSNNNSHQIDFNIMTVDDAPIGCEYGICSYEESDNKKVLKKLDDLKGFIFKEDFVPEYVEFQFSEKTPKKLSLQYFTDDNDTKEYTIDDSYQLKVPNEIGVHNFFATIEWENKTEYVFFRITVN